MMVDIKEGKTKSFYFNAAKISAILSPSNASACERCVQK